MGERIVLQEHQLEGLTSIRVALLISELSCNYCCTHVVKIPEKDTLKVIGRKNRQK